MIALTAASMAMSAYGQKQAGDAANEQAKYEAAILRNNAVLAQDQARSAKERGELEAVEHAKKVARLQGQQTAAFSANGIGVNTGSALSMLEATAEEGRANLDVINQNTLNEVFALQTQSRNFVNKSVLTSFAGKQAKTAGNIGAFGDILKTGATLGTDIKDWKKAREEP
jgi:hypothetical protein